ncbi:protein translocase subunit yajC [Bernardetia litoralis DSM 6794]|uniref:Sec translocon accessory complex subunit YajC n=1 Tax=Bernardetia litoralis (strain ATCC 23117 / DSM 6794 / NBRC 15988 / NCIMB 1366 / Fx l1 / Sio-4) TaxID=880071 RepID=I4AJU0_BERLS|nr:preprotein translocase subunit YajC [Bernardetia litoralis]AFM04225.1 protein translocase subunit yajC [Bernardetia litoralis DSM 6794]
MLLQSLTDGTGIANILMIVGMVAVFYFFLLRPQQQRAKKQKTFIESLTREMKVVTTGGMHGKIIDVSGETVTIEIDKGVRIKLDKTAIAYEAGVVAETKK